MIRQLTIDEVLALVKSAPEQSVYDWKADFAPPTDDEERGELIKDICAIANALATSYGHIVYGVDPRRPDPLIGISNTYDDARLQQLVQGKVEPPIEFVYYKVAAGPRVVGVIQVQPTRRRPHIIRVDLGKIRKGQIVIRRGSSTDGVTLDDLIEFFYGNSSGYFPSILQRLHVAAAQQSATTDYLRELREQRNEILKQAEITGGVPPGTLGAKW
jgi:predicted HTH transcriptional regulator